MASQPRILFPVNQNYNYFEAYTEQWGRECELLAGRPQYGKYELESAGDGGEVEMMV